MINWRTNLGGAIGTLGTSLAGVGTITSLVQLSNGGGPNKFVLGCTASGFILGCIGKSVTALFAADAKDVASVLQEHANQINQLKADTSTFAKPAVVEQNKV